MQETNTDLFLIVIQFEVVKMKMSFLLFTVMMSHGDEACIQNRSLYT